MNHFPLHTLFPELPLIRVVDVGSSPLEDPLPYQVLLDEGAVSHLTEFEANPEAFEEIKGHGGPKRTILPYALGDGSDGVLKVCQSPGMTSLLEPNMEVLEHFHMFAEWGKVVRRLPVKTRRLDDLSEVGVVDYLKMDVQGGELGVFRGGMRTLGATLFVHLEIPFVPLYHNQPMFGELDACLRSAGFAFHAFEAVDTRALKPVKVDNQVAGGLHQWFEADAVYVRSFLTFSSLEPMVLLKIARVANDLWGSFDMAALALGHFDKKKGTTLQATYLKRLGGQE
jgi:FkbM family methyltransferase